MPELPEVETIKRGLEKLIVNRMIESITSDNPKSFPNLKSDVRSFACSSKVLFVRRRAKVLIIGLDSGYGLVIHLKMTGQLVFASGSQHFGAGHPSASLINSLPDKSTRVIIKFTDGSNLFFNDQRKFGWMKLVPLPEITNLNFFANLGPEPLEESFNWQQLKRQMTKRPNSAVKPVLMDQSIVAGIGNIYADESLWGSKINPAIRVRQLRDKDYRNLTRSIKEILELSLLRGGSTDRNYVDAEGRRGNYLEFARVFRREGQPCLRCSKTIVKIRLSGRGTHFCPHCQPLPAESKRV